MYELGWLVIIGACAIGVAGGGVNFTTGVAGGGMNLAATGVAGGGVNASTVSVSPSISQLFAKSFDRSGRHR